MNKKKFTPEDMKSINYVSCPAVSPDGSKAAYVISKGREADGGFSSKIKIVDLAEGSETELDRGSCNQKMPAFISDEKIAYLSDEPGTADMSGTFQIWIKDMADGASRKITSARHGVTRFEVSADGSKAVFQADLWQEEIEAGLEFKEMTGEETAAWNREIDWHPNKIDDLTYKMDEWYGVRNGSLPHIGTADLNSGEQLLATADEFEAAFPAVSGDGSMLAFYGYPHKGADGRRAELFVCNADGSGRKQLSDKGYYFSADSRPLFTADGKSVFAGFYDMETSELLPLKAAADGSSFEIMLTRPEEGQRICFGVDPVVISRTEYGDKAPYMQLSADGSKMIFLSAYNGRSNIYEMSATEPGPAECLIKGDTDIHTFAVGRSGRIAYVMGRTDMPAELFADGKRLTDSNGWLDDFDLGEVEEFWIDTADKEARLQVWLVHPAAQEKDKKYPAVLDIHGGPECCSTADFWHEYQALAGAGMAVIYTNPRGSTGYEPSFCKGAISWSDKAVDDLLAAVDACVAKGFIDPEKIGVTGGSYGGYMTNKLIINTDRFAAAVAQRCLINTATSYGTGDMGFISSDPEAKDVSMLDYLTDRARHSLIRNIDNVKVPVLILHGFKDYRCSFEQAEQFFISMKERHPEIPVRLVMFPEENHGLTRTGKLYNQVRHLSEMTSWFVKYLSEGGQENE